jgi:hypothetical protein
LTGTAATAVPFQVTAFFCVNCLNWFQTLATQTKSRYC